MNKKENHKKKKNKILIAISIVVCVAIVGFVAYRIYYSFFYEDPNENYYEEYVNEADCALLIYGEDILFNDILEYEKIDTITEVVLERDSDYIFLIINDLNGSASFDTETFLFLKEYADKHPNFNFYYIGTSKLSVIKENIEDCNLNENDASFGYVVYDGERIQHYGVWRPDNYADLEKNEYSLGEQICFFIEMMIRSNE